jgi:hypothetical protein
MYNFVIKTNKTKELWNDFSPEKKPDDSIYINWQWIFISKYTCIILLFDKYSKKHWNDFVFKLSKLKKKPRHYFFYLKEKNIVNGWK